MKPVFIVGHPRSGSTLLTSLLGKHQNLGVFPETHYISTSFRMNFVLRLLVFLNPRMLISLLYKRNIRLLDMPVSPSEFTNLALKVMPKSFPDLFSLLLEENAKKVGKIRPVEKTPTHIEFIDTIMTWFPDAKVVCIIRDGRDAVKSLMSAPWTHSNLERHAAYWGWCVREAYRCKNKYPGNFLLVRFEDLLGEVDKTLHKICNFIEEPYDENQLLDAGNDMSVPAWEKQWKDQSTLQPDSNMAYKWKKDPVNSEAAYIQYFIDEELETMGYEAIDSVVPVALGKRFFWNRVTFDILFACIWFFRTYLLPRNNPYRRKLL